MITTWNGRGAGVAGSLWRGAQAHLLGEQLTVLVVDPVGEHDAEDPRHPNRIGWIVRLVEVAVAPRTQDLACLGTDGPRDDLVEATGVVVAEIGWRGRQVGLPNPAVVAGQQGEAAEEYRQVRVGEGGVEIGVGEVPRRGEGAGRLSSPRAVRGCDGLRHTADHTYCSDVVSITGEHSETI
ncbi:hypothetical protein ACFOJ6_03560 [Gordonia humi]|uniref:hypothetical protein n=1 Tax=Gordonia humi TaxID=686429 RepID=UPI00360A16F7